MSNDLDSSITPEERAGIHAIMFDPETGRQFGERLMELRRPGQTISELIREREAFAKTPEGQRAAAERWNQLVADHKAKYPTTKP